MGKRELLIVSAFIVAGIVAYQLAAPPAEEGRQGFSFSNFVASLRREVRGNRATASVTTRGSIGVTDSVSEVRISNITKVQVAGEARQDVSYELTVESNGPDEAAARANATQAGLTQDTVGGVLALRSAAPRNIRQTATLVLKVPARLMVRIAGAQGGARLEASDVAALQLDGIVGDVRATRIVGNVTGTHRNGEIVVSESGGVSLTLVSSKAGLEGVTGAIVITARNGRCRIVDARGSIELDLNNEEVTIVRPAGTVRAGGSGGTVIVDDPLKSVSIDVRRTEVNVTLTRAVPLTVLTTDVHLGLSLTGSPAIALDAVAVDGGTINASDFSLVPVTGDQESRVRYTFDAGAAPVALRNQRGEIVISRTK